MKQKHVVLPPGVLKIKPGYNPNSSSIGIHVSYFVWGSAIFSVIVNALVAVAISLSRKRTKTPHGVTTAGETTE